MRILPRMLAKLILCRLAVCAGIMPVFLAGCAPISVDYYSRANDSLNAGQYEQAIADYTEFILLNPRYAHAYYNRGRAYAALGEYDHATTEYDRAITDFDQVLAIKPQFAEVYVRRANCYRNKSQYDRALIDYDKAVNINPRYADAYFQRAITCDAKGRYEWAVADYNKFLDVCPENFRGHNNHKAYMNRAVTYYHMGEYEKAWADVAKLREFRFGYPTYIDQQFLQELRVASGRER